MNEFIIIIGLILLNGIFAMAEIAVVSSRKSSISSDASRGNKSARTALKLIDNPDRFLSTIQIGITLIGILTGIYSGNKIAAAASDLLVGWGASPSVAPGIAQTVIVIAVTYLTLIFGELLPKRIGMSMAERITKIVARPMYALSVVAGPFVWILTKSTQLFFRISGVRTTSEKVTEDEIKSMIQQGTEEGEVQPVEQDIMQRVFVMGDLKISSLMTHKSDVVWIDTNASAEEVRKTLEFDLYEMYPVADNDLDHIVGMVSLKDLFFNIGSDGFKWEGIVKKPVYFHENMSVYKVLEEMKQKRISRALVCDEFGEFQGIITLKDILDGLIGAVADEGEEEPIVKRDNAQEWLVDGQCSIYDFLCYFEIEEQYETSEYSTVGGLILNSLEHVPSCGESVRWKGFILEVADMDGARIDKVLVRKEEQHQ